MIVRALLAGVGGSNDFIADLTVGDSGGNSIGYEDINNDGTPTYGAITRRRFPGGGLTDNVVAIRTDGAVQGGVEEVQLLVAWPSDPGQTTLFSEIRMDGSVDDASVERTADPATATYSWDGSIATWTWDTEDFSGLSNGELFWNESTDIGQVKRVTIVPIL